MFGGGERQRYDGDFFLSSDDDISYLLTIFFPSLFLRSGGYDCHFLGVWR